jgi:hypothetical protein
MMRKVKLSIFSRENLDHKLEPNTPFKEPSGLGQEEKSRPGFPCPVEIQEYLVTVEGEGS